MAIVQGIILIFWKRRDGLFNDDYIDIGEPEHAHITQAVGVR